jgi:hypothetical protein
MPTLSDKYVKALLAVARGEVFHTCGGSEGLPSLKGGSPRAAYGSTNRAGR